jgi:hypothetical protein
MTKDLEVLSSASTDIAAIDAVLAAKAAALQKNIALASNHISLKDKKFRLPNGTVVDSPQELPLVVLDYRFHNRFYDQPWDPDNPVPPVCFAISETNRGMVPSPNAPKPQAASCDECPLNEYGSKGKGKACRNILAMAVMDPDLQSEAIMSLNASPIAQRDISQYLLKCTKIYGHVIKAITNFRLVDAPRGFKLEARAGNRNERYAEHVTFLNQAEELVTAEPQAQADDDAIVEQVQTAPSTSGPATRRSHASS